jgi:V8-like Glu-specific endopeptidase
MRQWKRPVAGAGLAAVVASGLVSLTHGPAQAGPRGADSPVVVHSTGVDTAAEAQRVRDFWTPRRMRQAVPLAGELTATELLKAKDKPPKPGKPSHGGVSTGGRWTDGGTVVATTGKVFFVLDGGQFTCSAGVVESANDSTVVTAGHCLNDGRGTFAEEWYFVPAYRDGAPDNPYGDWVATSLFTTEQWAGQGDTDYDVGMAVMEPLESSDLLTDVVGAQSIAFDRQPSLTHAFGYPTNKSYKGNKLAFCSGEPTAEPDRDTDALRLACDMGSGSSGGPWLQDFDHTTGAGTQVAVTSFGYADDKKGIYGPYFGAEALAVYQQAESTPVD